MLEIPKNSLATRVAASVRTPQDLRGPAGRLEALYTSGRADAPCAVVLSHPHPLFGGTMHNKVVYHAAKVFQQLGWPVLRYNFRGAGASEGQHDRGEGEQQDFLAALAWLRQESGLPLLAAGFSFGAWVTLRACCAERGNVAVEGVRGLVALGLPIQAGNRSYSYDFLAGCTLPKLFISGSADEFGPIAEVTAAVAQASPPAQLIFIPGVDHFFQGQAGGLQTMQAAMRTWIEASFAPLAPTARAHTIPASEEA